MAQLENKNQQTDRLQSSRLAPPIAQSGEEVAVGWPGGRELCAKYKIDGNGKLLKSPVGKQNWSEAQSEVLLYVDGGKFFDSQGVQVDFGRQFSVADSDFGNRDFISPQGNDSPIPGQPVIFTRLARPDVIRRNAEAAPAEGAEKFRYTEAATGEEVTFRRSGALVTFKFKLAGDGTLLFANPGREDWCAARRTGVVFLKEGKLANAQGDAVESIGVGVDPTKLNFRGRDFIALDGATYQGKPVLIAGYQSLNKEQLARPMIATPREEEVRLSLGRSKPEARSVRISRQGQLEVAYPGSDNFAPTNRATLLFYENGSVVTHEGRRVEIGDGIKADDFGDRNFISPILNTRPALVITRLPRPARGQDVSNLPPLRLHAGEALRFDRASGEEFKINYGNGGDVNKFKVGPEGELLTAGAGKEIWSPARRTTLLYYEGGKLVDQHGAEALSNLDIRAEDFGGNTLIHLVGKTHHGKPVLVTNLPRPAAKTTEKAAAIPPVTALKPEKLEANPNPAVAPLPNTSPAPVEAPSPSRR